MLIGFQGLAIILIFVTLWGLLPVDYWWVRGADFPRIQILWLGLISLLGLVFFLVLGESSRLFFDGSDKVLLLLLIVALIYQLKMVIPYTKIWRKQVKDASTRANADQIKIIVANVLMTNDNKQALIDLVNKQRPDVLLTLETNKAWETALKAIESDYPYTVKVPLENLYGMHLYSKIELIDPIVQFLIIDDIPSIHTKLRLNEQIICFYCLHPMPPSPTEAEKSTTRDAELLLVGRHIKEQQQPAILAGDLNDVAWSKTTRRFQRISGLLDPRIGRKFINTFHVRFPFLRWALDHIFHSPCFTVVRIERLPSIGSDHFPVLTILQFEPEKAVAQAQQLAPADSEEIAAAKQTIQEGKKEGEKISQEQD